MNAFHTGSYGERFQAMGDEAEANFERLNTNWIRFGFNRPDVAKFYQISPNIRAAPGSSTGPSISTRSWS